VERQSDNLKFEGIGQGEIPRRVLKIEMFNQARVDCTSADIEEEEVLII